ncbi:branched-chain amino acid transport system ATP-binding protein [Pseudochelatococcus lubricantis]|uniref:Branched-chain amino acid transport system ATP-binding protein n=1 Tax=Pseudochelatococcus lubricantis TaxID=1538102 RepID=A0ABX0V436_9HYPH|nr:ABC transporter ATP-binding protein [Pseudochelatococcus lubricantis]NIJ59966.1 branched-chain amino acid transport system ATP-binding protein [Pseudochelatococcus lubricantis]
MTLLLKVENLTVAYGKVEAISGVGLAIPEGRIVTVIGPNGAGKSTLLNAVMGLLPSRGRIVYAGQEVMQAKVEARVGAGLCLVPEKRELFAQMSVADNLLLGGYSRRHVRDDSRARDLDAMYTLFPRLRERHAQQARTLSGGERQMLALARALMARPKLLMLDEPSLGLAPRIVREVLEAVASLRDRGMSVLLVEQNARAALSVADYAYVLETGTVALEGPAREVAANPRVTETYIGVGHGAGAQREASTPLAAS